VTTTAWVIGYAWAREGLPREVPAGTHNENGAALFLEGYDDAVRKGEFNTYKPGYVEAVVKQMDAWFSTAENTG
jgi:hypothetical protein